MNKLNGNQIRQKWLDFFKSKGHYVIESKSLVPVNDPSLLWINSGVATLKNYFSGKSVPPAVRLTNSQRCLRTNDIENVGVTARHQTLFEMLGNFSIGDYFKKEAINFAYELLINEYQLEKEKLYITVFEEDKETYQYWLDLKINPNHIIKCDKSRNFWDLGQGPCGPCTEIYYDRGIKYDPKQIGEKLFKEDIENDRYVEIWNIVFSQFNNDGNNNYTELSVKNIDTGSGLERLASVIQEVPTNFDTDLFLPIIKEIQKFTTKTYNIDDYFLNDLEKHKIQISFRVIADHIKACVFAIADGITPGPKDRNYIVRRLIRRAIVHAFKLNIDNKFFEPVVKKIIEIYQDFFVYLKDQSEFIIKTIVNEENIFNKTIKSGLDFFNNALENNQLDGKTIFKLVETYGFPIELIKELADEKQLKLDWASFNQLFKEHQDISKSNKNVIAIEKQNKNLLEFHDISTFDYHQQKIKAKVIALFDENFNCVNKIKNSSGYVVFDKTVIYATSGGQRFDNGYAKKMFHPTIYFDNVIKAPNLQHLHHFKKANIKLNQKFLLWHDPQWRNLIRKNHSLEHILHSALKKVISPTIKQEGAFKSAEKATLDFTYPERLTDLQLNNIEQEIRKVIKNKIPIQVIMTDLEGSKKLNAIAYFNDEYKKHDKLRVIKMDDYSIELCGGTHVDNTAEIEDCYIVDCSSRGTGSWRIEIISSYETIKKYFENQLSKIKEKLHEIKNQIIELKINDQTFLKHFNEFKLPNSINELREAKHKINELVSTFQKIKIEANKKQIQNEVKKLKLKFQDAIKNDIAIVFLENIAQKEINLVLNDLTNENPNNLFVVFNKTADKIQYFVAIKNPSNKYDANEVIKKINQKYAGRGGGKNNFAQGGTTRILTENQISSDIKNIISG